jgi:hypothetical protein
MNTFKWPNNLEAGTWKMATLWRKVGYYLLRIVVSSSGKEYSENNLDVRCYCYCYYVRNSVTSTDAKKPGRIQRKFAARCQYRFFTHDQVTREDFVKFLELHSLHNKSANLDALSPPVCCAHGWHCYGVLPCNFRNVRLLTATCKISPSARIVSVANHA